jgi:hypothetical protein
MNKNMGIQHGPEADQQLDKRRSRDGAGSRASRELKPRALLSILALVSGAMLQMPLNASAQERDTCTHTNKVFISEVEYVEYGAPGLPQVGPPKSSTEHGVWCNPEKLVAMSKTRYQFINGEWKPGDTVPYETNDCYNDHTDPG